MENILESSKITGEIVATIRDAKTGEIKRQYFHRNIIVTVGRSVVAQRLAGTTTYTGTLNYGALGTNVAAPASGDTQLGTETFRKLVASATYSVNIAYIDFFFTATDCNGTYREFGNFIDGGAGANTGQLWSHVAVNWVKSASETLTISCIYQIQ